MGRESQTPTAPRRTASAECRAPRDSSPRQRHTVSPKTTQTATSSSPQFASAAPTGRFWTQQASASPLKHTKSRRTASVCDASMASSQQTVFASPARLKARAPLKLPHCPSALHFHSVSQMPGYWPNGIEPQTSSVNMIVKKRNQTNEFYCSAR